MTSSMTSAAGPWDRYGRRRLADDQRRGAEGRLYWDWYQRLGPGAEILGPLDGRTVADLGAGNGRQAAHIALVHAARRVLAIDTSPAQISRGRAAFGQVPGLEFVTADAATHLLPAAVDVAYSAFGAACFTDPRTLLPAVAAALRPGGTLVIATLAHYRSGEPPESDVRPAAILVRHDDGTRSSVSRWVLDPAVWRKLLTAAGFTGVTVDVIEDPGPGDQPPMATALIRARRPD